MLHRVKAFNIIQSTLSEVNSTVNIKSNPFFTGHGTSGQDNDKQPTFHQWHKRPRSQGNRTKKQLKLFSGNFASKTSLKQPLQTPHNPQAVLATAALAHCAGWCFPDCAVWSSELSSSDSEGRSGTLLATFGRQAGRCKGREESATGTAGGTALRQTPVPA